MYQDESSSWLNDFDEFRPFKESSFNVPAADYSAGVRMIRDDLDLEEDAAYFLDDEEGWSSDFAEFETDLLEDPDVLAEALSVVLHEDYTDATAEQLQQALSNIRETMTPAEAFNFNKVLRSVSKAGQSMLKNPVAGQIAKTALPIAGGALGTVVGGPIGTALGAKLGQAAGAAFTSGAPQVSGSPHKAHGVRVPSPASSPQAGSAAAAQLLQLTQDPNMLKSLLALSLGSNGSQSIPISGGPSVPAGAFMTLLSTLAGKAAADADAFMGKGENTRAYLLDGEGELLVDPSVPENRAGALYELLCDAECNRLESEAESYLSSLEFEDEVQEDDFFDE
ncbi:MAG: hypothetical protein GY815_05420 [Gammaproteobacteria bacterium]|nr:hypothetical protein [Gammaproteobacteria bacterium]